MNTIKEKILTRREEYIAAAIGLLIGSIFGAFMSASYIQESNEYEFLKNENQNLREIIWKQESYIEQQALQND